jgi:hypothetical protein
MLRPLPAASCRGSCISGRQGPSLPSTNGYAKRSVDVEAAYVDASMCARAQSGGEFPDTRTAGMRKTSGHHPSNPMTGPMTSKRTSSPAAITSPGDHPVIAIREPDLGVNAPDVQVELARLRPGSLPLELRAVIHRGLTHVALFWTFLVFGIASFSNARAASDLEPIVLVPGILGSRLVDQYGTPVWDANIWTTDASQLRLFRVDPRNPAGDLHPAGVITNQWSLLYWFKSGPYEPIIDLLKNHGYELDKNLFLFSYDWRLSNFRSAEKLAATSSPRPSGLA